MYATTSAYLGIICCANPFQGNLRFIHGHSLGTRMSPKTAANCMTIENLPSKLMVGTPRKTCCMESKVWGRKQILRLEGWGKQEIYRDRANKTVSQQPYSITC